MCGLAGVISNRVSFDELYKNTKSMSSKISHRGPDDFGFWIDEKLSVALAHNRLSIIDLSQNGHQPMKSKNGRFIISFNGEIYNHKEIRKYLDTNYGTNAIWKGNSDTEVLITAIELIGLHEALNLIKGMFAFALWDKRHNKMYLIRDRFGEKPLYWGFIDNKYRNQKNLFFASELNAFKGLPFFNNEICKEGLNQYFNYGYIASPNSIYNQIYQLPPGNFLEINQKKFIECSTYKPSPLNWYKFEEKKKIDINIQNHEEIVEIVENLITQSIEKQSCADVPVCTFLSGGIDSSVVSTLLQKIKREKVNTLTISFPEYLKSKNLFDEGPFAKKIANHLGTNHTEIPLTAKEALDIIPSLPEIYSEPFSDSSQIATYLLCNATKKAGYKVALTGDGADEIFGGYNRHIFLPKIYRYFGKCPNKLKRVIISLVENFPLSSEGLIKDKRQKLISAINKSSSIEDIYEGVLNLWNNQKHNILLDEYRLNKTSMDIPIARSTSERIMLKDLFFYLPSDILVKTDRASMANSIETRTPFLDHEIAEFSTKLPLEMKTFSNKISRSGKIILKDILKKYIPEDMFIRPKAGFSVPIGRWIKSPLKEWANDLLSEQKINEQGFLDYKLIKYMWDKHLNDQYDYTPQLWCILMWQAWLEKNRT